MALVFGLMTAMMFGVGDFLAGRVTREAPVILVVVYAQAIGALLMMPIVLAGGVPLELATVFWGALSGVSLGAAFMFYFRSLADEKMGIASALTGVASAVMPVVIGFGLGDRPGMAALIGIVLVIIAVALISQKEPASVTDVSRGAMQKALVGGLLFGLFFVFLNVPAAEQGMWGVLITMTSSFIFTAAFLSGRVNHTPATANFIKLMIPVGVLQCLGAVTFVLGVNIGLLSIVALAGAMSPVFTVLCARLIDNEQLTRVQTTGFAFALAGITLLVTG
ncbi:DMT family transporter [Salisediminibacterium halotolerans]|uniref:DMT family transporter n=1 Tax=Salisediminibacterium halotolerans TaxID=517425 RepID=UPI000EB37BCE|nr:DMT family transporter [Salisediminibacterium halotolerans]RLJ75667.1 EamA-like transporter family protein [Actinophytocola xinjiangensis]RPE89521.1 EamA-like transporter family protein [Salisediminibacterium halotolerans]TWG36280.1 EamA-like transporter family protein [Salisediminibacterium halotolerans]GEL07372.1 multidrug transporter [Salisediminibacterium halotolerans]